jgi:hypothetical protein
LGKPTLIVSSGCSILKNPIPLNISCDLFRICYDVDDIVKQVNYFMNLSNIHLINLNSLSAFYISDYIEANSFTASQNFLGLNK